MTENEAIKVLGASNEHIKMISVDGKDTLCYSSQMVCALEMAEKALEEIQQYRAMGTVEELQEIGTVNEIKKILKKHETIIMQLTNTVKEYQFIGTIEEFKDLKDKSVTKKVKEISLTHESRFGNCPNCNQFIVEKYDKRCPKCRIELEWEEK